MDANLMRPPGSLPGYLLLALLGGVSLNACAGECAPELHDGWVRLPPAAIASDGMAMMAGFGRIENRCSTPITIVSAHSVAFGEVSLHRTAIVDGISRMRAVPELRIAADAVAVLKPGGLHLMLMRSKTSLAAGDRITVEFELQDGRRLRSEFELRAPGE